VGGAAAHLFPGQSNRAVFIIIVNKSIADNCLRSGELWLIESRLVLFEGYGWNDYGARRAKEK
jgi:hypothetical protein